MAGTLIKALPANQLVDLTGVDILGELSFMNIGGHTASFFVMPDATIPAAETFHAKAIPFNPMMGYQGLLSELFRGETTPVRLIGYSAIGGRVWISHA